ncbi:hypothetical protein QP939_24325 [Amycolatopsis nalaikhensis]|uniref:Uncharacterized protein n=1 Tax=Amycolatopsis nalaikhensis TaxID=715472 RepID=A0ABY8Y0I5_9PSEU|nr:hypothetical protein [Amycolatopsis sp. 2-2]WIV61507.1 hypothetical protein QP939_24325 [Amycolatopsis sp. 2-2]
MYSVIVPAPQLLGDPVHRRGGQPVGIRDRYRGGDDPLDGQRRAAAPGRLGGAAPGAPEQRERAVDVVGAGAVGGHALPSLLRPARLPWEPDEGV